jgi:predicted phage baseplate assembly protein
VPLPSPILDDRSYLQLRDELVRRIPVYTPEWTDHNPSDPGITLLELFAFLGENLLYRFNQIPEATKLEFLKRLDVPLRPAVPARALLAFTTERPGGALAEIGTAARAGDVPFETCTETHVWPLSALGVARVRAAAPVQRDEPEVYELAVRAVDALRLQPGQAPAYYRNELVPIAADGIPADLPAAIDRALWVALKQEKGFDRAELGGAIINLGFVPDPAPPGPADTLACPGLEPKTRGFAVEWKVSLAALQAGEAQYRPLQIVGDTTEGLTREGVVRLRLPQDLAAVGVPALDDPARAGTGSLPPVLDEDEEAKLFCWLRAHRLDGADLPRTALLVANAAEACQATRARPEYLGSGTGQAGQRCPLVYKPVLAGTAVIEVEEEGGWTRWTEVDGFHASGPDDRHFRCDLEAGEIHFGDSEQGRAPQLGERIRALEYRYGGGSRGNLPPKAIGKVDLDGIKLENPLRTSGGADTESVERALDRIPGELRRRDRAVTAGDFRELALATPGVAIGRAECLPRFHAPSRTPERAGIVTVVVWPAEDPKQPDAPLPDRRVLRRVCEWLDARRLVTTELYAVPPIYRKVAVSVALQVKPGFGVEAVRRWVELVLRQYLAPLPPFGPTGEGWPLGRRVHGPELEAAALQVEGVEYLEGLAVAAWSEAEGRWIEGTVTLASDEVPWLTEIAVVSGATLPAPGSRLEPELETTPVPVPVVREEC